MRLPSRPLTSRFLIVLALVLQAVAVLGQTRKILPSPPAGLAVKTNIPYVDAKPMLEALRENLPAELIAKTARELEAVWPGWVSRHNAAIRARLERGDEDSIVNLWQYGTSFTKLPPVTERDIARLAGGANSVESILQGRMEDLVAGIASPGTNERLQFARQVVDRKGINPTTPVGKEQVRRHLLEARTRVLAELEQNNHTLQSARQLSDPNAELAAYLTMYRERGLSSDTSLLPAFAIEQALEAIKSEGMLGVGSVRRIAIVGPGLDFANKADGYDFYPQQTIQPFALIDSLIRLGLAKPDALRLTTFDLSPRVNQHIETARQRARAGSSYVLHLPLDGEEPWNPALVAYWRRLGDKIGTEVQALAPPSVAGKINVRAVRIPAASVMSIVPQDLNIVLERLEPLATEGRGAARGGRGPQRGTRAGVPVGVPARGATRAGVAAFAQGFGRLRNATASLDEARRAKSGGPTKLDERSRGAPRVIDERFDLIIATNILVYYDVFEQSLALINVARMLRPGGMFLSNTPVPPRAPMKLSPRYATVRYSDRLRDFVFWYQRQ